MVSATSVAAALAQTTSAPTGPSADAFVTSSQPNSNFGGAGALSLSPSSSNKGEFDSLIRFDTTAARNLFNTMYGAGNWTIQSMSLSLSSSTPSNTIFPGSDAAGGPKNAAGNFTVEWMFDGDAWTEGSGSPAAPGSTGVTFSNQPPVRAEDQLLGTLSFTGGNSGTIAYSLSSSSGVQADVSDAAASTLNLRFRAVSTSNIAYTFGSRGGGGGGGGGSPPQLTITAVPEPAIAGAVGAFAMLSSMAGRRRRECR